MVVIYEENNYQNQTVPYSTKDEQSEKGDFMVELLMLAVSSQGINNFISPYNYI